ncbi:MAG: GNAT family N-acetyltransferase [Proteobacteria bacterium]|nr:GNAT family N-acetyltransferase [Pseudomonadota bacterium]
MPEAARIESLSALGEAEIRALAEVLVDCVEGGASVSFMLPMTRAKAEGYWRGVAAALARRECLLVVARDAAGAISGTVQVLLKQPENQPHRADIAKMLVHRRARRQGAGALLLRAAEDAAVRAGKSLLVLDTASADAERLYARAGWQLVGEIPDYALWPQGGLVATRVFYKRIGAAAVPGDRPGR